MPREYSSSVRRQIVARLRSGEPVAAAAVSTGIRQGTLFRCKWQTLIDAGVIKGIPSAEADEPAAAHKRIAALEAELALTRDACELFDAQAVVPPKRRHAIAERLNSARTSHLIRLPDNRISAFLTAIPPASPYSRPRGAPVHRRRHNHRDPPANLKLVSSIMTKHGLRGLPRLGRHKPNLIGVDTPIDLIHRRFTATGPSELCCTPS